MIDWLLSPSLHLAWLLFWGARSLRAVGVNSQGSVFIRDLPSAHTSSSDSALSYSRAGRGPVPRCEPRPTLLTLASQTAMPVRRARFSEPSVLDSATLPKPPVNIGKAKVLLSELR